MADLLDLDNPAADQLAQPISRGGAERRADLPSGDNIKPIAAISTLVSEVFLKVHAPACGGDIRLIAFITDPAPIRKILLHLGEPLEPPPLAPARGPPTGWHELVQLHDDRDAIQAAPDELPAIDINSL